MFQLNDEVFKSDYVRVGDTVKRRLSQPTESLILERNAELRKDPGAIKDLEFGRWVGTIPLNDYEALCRKYPELSAGDGKQRQECLLKILNSEEGRKYLVQPKKRENRIYTGGA